MRLSWLIPALLAGIFIADASPAQAEHWLFKRRQLWSEPQSEYAPMPQGAVIPQVAPNSSIAPNPGSTPSNAPSPLASAAPSAATPDFSAQTSAALGDSFVAVSAPGYLDSAIPTNQVRLRYDAAYGVNRPDRAEYYYAKCGCFGGNARGPGGNPPTAERSVDFQDLNAYFELAPTRNFSVFVDAPIRWSNPDLGANTVGLADMHAGFKYAFLLDDCQALTFQFKTYLPTGHSQAGLGTHHVSLEPSILYWRKLSDRLAFFAQVGDWIPIAGNEFAGNVLMYGAGVSFNAYDAGGFKVVPIAEILGWSVLGGKQFSLQQNPTIRSADGVTIVNAKIGVRFEGERNDLYIGYGQALTNEVWYENILRVEYRIKF